MLMSSLRIAQWFLTCVSNITSSAAGAISIRFQIVSICKSMSQLIAHQVAICLQGYCLSGAWVMKGQQAPYKVGFRCPNGDEDERWAEQDRIIFQVSCNGETLNPKLSFVATLKKGSTGKLMPTPTWLFSAAAILLSFYDFPKYVVQCFGLQPLHCILLI